MYVYIRSAPLYSIPHFSFTITGFPVRSFRNGFGLTGTVCTGHASSQSFSNHGGENQ